MFWTSIKILHVSTECIPFAYVFKKLTGTFGGAFWHFIGVERSQVATTSREEGPWKEGTCYCCRPCTCFSCWCLSEDAFIHSWVCWVWKAVQGLHTILYSVFWILKSTYADFLNFCSPLNRWSWQRQKLSMLLMWLSTFMTAMLYCSIIVQTL